MTYPAEVEAAVTEAAELYSDDVGSAFVVTQARRAGLEMTRDDARGLVQAARKRRHNGRRDSVPSPEPATEHNPAWVSLADADPDELIHQRTRPVEAVPTPWRSVNAICRDDGGMQGLAAPWLITLGGPTGAGKSIALGNILATAIRSGATVGLISLEMLQRQTYTRFLATVSDTPVVQLERGPKFDPGAMRDAVGAVRKIRDDAGGEILTSDRRIFGLAGVLDAMRELADRGADLIAIDYLQLAANQNDARTITEASQRIRNLGFELDVVTVNASQFNRDPFRDGRKPTIHDLSGGSSIENDSDQVWLLDTSERQRAEPPRTGFYLSLNVKKNRHGPVVDVPLFFDTRTLTMTERTPDEFRSVEVA